MSAGGSARAVVAALLANLGIAVTKCIAFALTGSSSMLAEAIHSVVDSGNQALLLVGGKRATRRATAKHPFGFGRERYIYAFIVTIMLFTAGGLFALYEGYHKLSHPTPITEWQWVPIAVLVIGIALESFSFRTAIHEANHIRNGVSWPKFIRRSRVPELPVVLLEDFAALIGLVFALIGVGLTLVTGNGVWDGVGTIAIGFLLVVVAIVLAVEMKSLLIGESATPEELEKIERAIMAGDEAERIIHMRTVHVGPDDLLVAAKIAVRHDETAEAVAKGIDAIEKRIRETVPIAKMIYLEPDIYRQPAAGREAESALTEH
ncbi:cation diffusion facilitator family transporter [Planosporangium flavigriseum]|uniref:Transporter n=1 Tax=Planosporangium flavigriseum TaxID=373681 RepID=A0A8J3PL43_9ACTN|nr:cation diffusion facilitator family transporter [Planosporangium flavigriseum]NJC64939.1 cation diffusion facilitator family transporter [Planosporangium flavigriseum]GIG72814.1 transporter [Planosporangium flavigriseum]